jgi:hypothetical protein
MRKAKIVATLVVLMSTLLLWGSIAVAKDLPKVLVVATYGTAASADYLVETAMAPATEKITGMKVRIVGADARLTQFRMVRLKEAHIVKTHWGTGWRPMFGVEEFGAEDWGPQKLRMVWKGGPYYFTAVVKNNSEIKKIADLKGKKLAVYPGSDALWNGTLAYAGLSLKDVKIIPCSSYGDGIKLAMQGRADAAYASPVSGASYEMSSSPDGARFLPMPYEGSEKAWQKVKTICPAFASGVCPKGFGAEISSGIWMEEYPEAEYSYADLDDDVAYLVTKARAEGYDSYKSAYSSLKYWTLENAVNFLSVPTPYHPGSIRYFKEKGLWTAKHEQWQTKTLAFQDALAAEWQKAVKSAKEKNIPVSYKSSEWQDFWKTHWEKLFEGM